MTEQSLEEQRLAVIEQIAQAFDGVSRRDGTTLHEAFVMDDYGDKKAQLEARKLDTDERWQEVKNEDLASGHFATCFLDSEGYRYYLPALMIWSLNNLDGEESDNCTHDSIVYSLGMKVDDDFFACSHREIFTLEQKQAIAAYLHFTILWSINEDDFNFRSDDPDDPEDDQLCLDMYWGQFLEGD